MRAALLLAAGLLLVPAAARQDPEPAGEVAETALEQRMLDMEAALKALRRSVREAEKSVESLQHVHELQAAILASKLETPLMAGKLPEAERPAFVAAFREELVAMLAKSCELEIAVLHGDVERAREIHKAIADLEDPGHERFTEGG